MKTVPAAEHEALREAYLRLRAAAQAALDATNYPAGEEQARVYRLQLRDLERELAGEPQPHGLTWMSVS
jgi:hypothetical protein